MSDQQDDSGRTSSGGRGNRAAKYRRRRTSADQPGTQGQPAGEPEPSPYEAGALTAAVGIERTGLAADGRSRTLTAAVQVLASRRIQRPRGQATTPTQLPWQADAWRYYDLVGESRFAANWLASAVSRCRLHAARRPTGSDQPEVLSEGTAAEVLADFAGGPGGQAGLMRRAALQLVVTGDTYVVGRTVEADTGVGVLVADGETHEWGAYSTEETTWDGGGWRINPGNGSILLGDQDVIFRCWLPHPRRFVEADSAFRSALTVLRELQGLTDRISAEIDSRLAGAGLLVLPQEFSLPAGQAADGEQTAGVEAFIETLIEYMMEPIRDRDTAAAIVPLVITAPGEFISDVKLISFWSELDQQTRELREAALDRFGRSMDMPPEVIKGLGSSNHWCTLPHVQALTVDGWRTHDQLAVGDLILTLNHDTGLSEWQPVQAINVWDVTDEPMVEITGRRHHSVTTMNHRWPVLSGARPRYRKRAWATTADVLDGGARDPEAQRGTYLVLAAPHADLPAEPKYSDALVELVAWFFTEGSFGARSGRNALRVTIHQSHAVNPDNCARIRRALTALFGPASDKLDKGGRYASPESVERSRRAREMRAENPRMSASAIGRELGVSSTMASKYLAQEPKTGDNVPRWREITLADRGMTWFRLNGAAAAIIAEHAPGRVVSLDFVRQLTAAQLELFTDTAVRGDGSFQKGSGTPVLGQKDPAMLDAYELAVILSGRSPYTYSHTSEGIGAHGPRVKTQQTIIAGRATSFAPRGRGMKQISHTGVVWCPTTANRTWLARDNGSVFYTGNSAWAASEDAVKMHIAPLAGIIAEAFTVGYFVPALRQLGVADAADYMIWVDTSPLELKPDKGAAARELYAELLVGPATVRRENGFGDADAPTDPELTRMLLLRALDRVSDPLVLLRALGMAIGIVGDESDPLIDAPAIAPPDQAATPEQPPADAAAETAGDTPADAQGVPATQDAARAGGQ